MNVLVICAHPDDDVLGVGGTLAKHSINGDHVYSCILCEHATARSITPEHGIFLKQINEAVNIIGLEGTMFFDFPNLKMNTVPTLDLVQSIEEAIVRFRPAIIYAHHAGDLHDDHRIAFNATMAAVRLPERGTRKELPIDLIKEVLCFEIPSSTDWAFPSSGPPFRPNIFVDIKETFGLKMAAFRQYAEVVKQYPHPRSIENLEALAKCRGAQSGLELAEAFMLMRGVR